MHHIKNMAAAAAICALAFAAGSFIGAAIMSIALLIKHMLG